MRYEDRTGGKSKDEIRELMLEHLKSCDDFVVLCSSTNSDCVHATACWDAGDTRTIIHLLANMMVHLMDEEARSMGEAQRVVIDPRTTLN